MRFILILLLLLPSIAEANLRDGLVGWWKMDEASGNLFDSSWNGNTGTVVGTTVIYNCQRNACRSMNGTVSDLITTPSAAINLNVGTITGWFKPAFASGASGPFFFDSDTARHAIFTSGAVSNMVMYNDARQTTFTCSWNANQWYYFTWIYNKTGNVQRFLINGVEQTPTTPTGTWGSSALGTNFYIGRRIVDLSTNWYPGLMDDVRTYNRVLTQQEILDLMKPGIRIGHVPGT